MNEGTQRGKETKISEDICG